ncbi:TPA: type II toxin-antitoxin system YafQ family toxin [Pseudomonas aeruginosa]
MPLHDVSLVEGGLSALSVPLRLKPRFCQAEIYNLRGHVSKNWKAVSFSEDDCTRQRGLKAVVQSSIERTVSGVRCTNDDLKPVLVALATDQPLDVRYRDHDLSGDWAGYRECHIKPDLLLIYRKSDADTLRLARLGSHSELFG